MSEINMLKPWLISISPQGGYIVSYDAQVCPRVHRIKQSGEEWLCDCGTNCEALSAVKFHLESGGRRAPQALQACPICGSSCQSDPTSFGTKRDPAWRCLLGGHEHQVLARAQRLAEGFKSNPWLFPPILDAAGEVLYEGVRRADILSFEEALVINRRIFETTGYRPAM